MAGRPKMTDKQKAAAKALRETDNEPAPQAGKPEKAQKLIFNSEIDEQEKALFLNHHLPAVRTLRAKVTKATADLRNAYKKAKAEGNFLKVDFDTAFAVETAENEAKERAKIARQLRIAKIMGSSLGAQLDLFLEPDRTPSVDIAYEEGRNASIQNKKASPKYDPSTEQHRRYMEGFHAHQAKLAKGIGKLDKEVEDDDPPPAAASGVAMTRAQFKAQQEARQKEEADDDGGSAFQKRTAH